MEEYIHIRNEIIHYITLLNTLNIKHISCERFEKIKNFLDNIEIIEDIVEESIGIVKHVIKVGGAVKHLIEGTTDHVDEPMQIDSVIAPIIPINNKIVEIPNAPPDYIKKVAYLRECEGLSVVGNNIIFNKRKFLFDNIFESKNENSRGLITVEVGEFISMRLLSNKPSCVINYGYSGSGKSFFSSDLIKILNANVFSLHEIYLNKIYVYNKITGQKILLPQQDKIDDEKYMFKCNVDEIIKILSKFSTVRGTELNATSSRAHTIITCYFHSNTPGISAKMVPCQIIDLCGNEKFINVASSGMFEKPSIKEIEMKYINKSLFSISQYLSNPNRYKNNKCELFNAVKSYKNIVFTLFFKDIKNSNLYSRNHLALFKDLYKK